MVGNMTTQNKKWEQAIQSKSESSISVKTFYEFEFPLKVGLNMRWEDYICILTIPKLFVVGTGTTYNRAKRDLIYSINDKIETYTHFLPKYELTPKALIFLKIIRGIKYL